MISRWHIGIGTICCFLGWFLIPATSEGATGEILVASPVFVDGTVAVPVVQKSIEVSGTYILFEDSTPKFTGTAELCASGIGTFQPDFWEGAEPGGGPMGHYAELSYKIDQGSRHKISTVRYGHAYKPGTEYDQLNTLLDYSFSVSVANLDKSKNHQIVIELIDIYSLTCKPLVWWHLKYEKKMYGDVIKSFVVPFYIGEQVQDDPAQVDHDPGGCGKRGNQVPID